jgi:Zn finger protein HypA/HybF involved in hydrogenase expression
MTRKRCPAGTFKRGNKCIKSNKRVYVTTCRNDDEYYEINSRRKKCPKCGNKTTINAWTEWELEEQRLRSEDHRESEMRKMEACDGSWDY